jgi:hypothetical protein
MQASGERQMKRIIDGKTYNIDTSTLVGQYEYEDDQDRATTAEVYVNRGGAFFIVHSWMAQEDHEEPFRKFYFEASSREDIERLIASPSHGRNFEIVDARALTAPPEAEAETDSASTAYLRLPVSLKQRIEGEAQSAGLSLNAWAIRCLESCCAQRAPKLVAVNAIESSTPESS